MKDANNHLKSAPPYCLEVSRDDSGQINIDPRPVNCRFVAFKVWHQRALDSVDRYLGKPDKQGNQSE